MISGVVSISFSIIIFSFSVGIDYFQSFEISFEVTKYKLKKPFKVLQIKLKFGKWVTRPQGKITHRASWGGLENP